MQIGTRVLQKDYDAESDTLYLYTKKEKVAASVSLGNLIIDFAKNGEVTGLEFLNATVTMPPLLIVSPKSLFEGKGKLKKDALEHINKANVSVHTAADFFVVVFALEIGRISVEGRLNLPVPSKGQEKMANILATC